ncbi:ribosome maturation factor RimP [Corynebacterium poyangense]|uniref:Ribosome maturation factor RimP n=1 Tax=Corynebacterium poyangense TaxID=2684405 RepID=A0A7H0SPG8_9CORY|nr:ribosome maturation factor RimP [Corynebacterium poyangense]MBZ8178023.1 ribosome maturation factor RimP [Corynebacterium poyangense]QNQ90443.1 ribosome maturation factor RimP [Corynebacterium poyangense]
MAFPTQSEIMAFVTPIASPYDMDVEDVRVQKAGKKSLVRIAVAADSAPGLDDLEQLSREISQQLDAAEEAGTFHFGPGYTLEVTTPGVDFPLTLPRHWRRNRFRAVQLTEDGERSQWRIGAVKDESVVLVSREKKPHVRIFELAPNVAAMVEIEFAQPPQAERDLCALSFEEAEERQGN